MAGLGGALHLLLKLCKFADLLGVLRREGGYHDGVRCEFFVVDGPFGVLHTPTRVPKCQISCAGGFVLANFAQSFDNPMCAIKAQKT